MIEWRLTPEYIINNWTDEELTLMVDKLNKRQEQRAKPDASVGSDIHNPDGAAEISDSQMFMNMGNRVVWTREE